MTYLDKLKKDKPSVFITSDCTEIGCPDLYGYGDKPSFPCRVENCKKCWNREMPNTEPSEKEFDIATQGYSKGYSVGKEDGYNQGLNDALELIRKLYDMKCDEFEKIFGVGGCFYEVIRDFTLQEALAKLKAYEEAQKIEVGDVVEIISKSSKSGNFYGIILTLGLDEYYVLTTNYTVPQKLPKNNYVFKKIGKHVDFISILKQIGE